MRDFRFVDTGSGSSWPGRSLVRCLAGGIAALLALLGCDLCPRSAQAAMWRQRDLPVRILLDNSGSMYPGYRPGGLKKSELGVKFFRENPEFRAWLTDFVALQTVLNGETISLHAVTSTGAYERGKDIVTAHPPVPLDQFDANRALDRFGPSDWGKHTYLAESLDDVTRGFEGLVWLITDNIVEAKGGQPDVGVVRFFMSLRDTERYRSVHLFKLPFRDSASGQRADLAIYGILVSPQEIDDAAFYDRRFRENFRRANRRSAPGKLFPGQEHLKLKDLSIDALDLKMRRRLQVDLQERQRTLFRETQTVRLPMGGTIRSNLTQHSVVGGSYTLGMVTALQPDHESAASFGVGPLSAKTFGIKTEPMKGAIPPTGSTTFESELQSKEPISLDTQGLGAWVRAAAYGLRVEYTGFAEIAFSDIKVRLERDRMAGIFGVDKASRVFDFQDIQSINVRPDRAEVSFFLEAGGRRGLLLLLALLPIAALIALLVWFLLRTESYRVSVGAEPPTVVPLRRLGRHRIDFETHHIGSLVRGLGGRPQLAPNELEPGILVTAGSEAGSFRVTVPERAAFSLWIAPVRSDGPIVKLNQPTLELPGSDVLTPREIRRPGSSPSDSTPSTSGAKPRIRRPGDK